MSYSKHNFQDGQVLTGAAMDDIDEAVYDLTEDDEIHNAQLAQLRSSESATKVLTNNLAYPFNNSKASVALMNARDNIRYHVEIISVNAAGGPAGEIKITDRQTNGFKMEYTGSASTVSVTYAVTGGYGS